jgi:hypothetical protein
MTDELEQCRLDRQRVNEQNAMLRGAIRGLAHEVLELAKQWRLSYPKEGAELMSPQDFVRDEVFCECATALEEIGAARTAKLGYTAEELYADADGTLPLMHPLGTLVNRARSALEQAARELDGTEHPALWELTQSLKWTLVAIENLKCKVQS